MTHPALTVACKLCRCRRNQFSEGGDRMKSTRIVWALLLGALLATTANAAQAEKDKGKNKDEGITLTAIGRYSAGAGGTRAEIAAYDPATQRLFAINADQSRIDVLDISTPHLPTTLAPIPLAAGFLPNSIAIHDGIVAVALQADPKTSPGSIFRNRWNILKRTHRRRTAGYASLQP